MTRFLYLLTLAASVILAAGAAAAAGGTRPDDRATHGPGSIDVVATAASLRPDDRATHGPGALELGTSSEIVRPDDRAWRGVGSPPTAEIVESPSLLVDGFDWADAALGAVAALGFGLLLAGAAALVLRRQRAAALS
jgi:hypothetical protein